MIQPMEFSVYKDCRGCRQVYVDVTAYELKKVADQEETFQVEVPIRGSGRKKNSLFLPVSECVKDIPCFVLTQRMSMVGGLWLWFSVCVCVFFSEIRNWTSY